MKVQRRVTRSAATGATTVTVTVISEDGIKASYAMRATQSTIGQVSRAAHNHALAGMKQLTDERQEPL